MARRGTGTLGGKLTLLVAIGVACTELQPLEDEGNAGGGGSGGSTRGGASGGTAKGGTSSSNKGGATGGGNKAGAAGDGGAGGGPRHTREYCTQYDTTAQCEAAGCFAADGPLYRLTSSGGGAGGAGGGGGLGGAPHCELVENDAFVACVENGAAGHPIAIFGCEEDCEFCVWSGWYVDESKRFTRDDCGTYCE